MLAGHMLKQLKEHELAVANTNALFEQLLMDLEELVLCFKNAFEGRQLDNQRAFTQIDADRSVGILNILWHTVSFTTRGNTRPQALHRPGREPVFTGRIVAMHGNFGEFATTVDSFDFSGLLEYEIASLFVPADKTSPAIMTIKHLGDEEHYFHQADASRLFLLKTIEMVCGGGFLHERG